MSIQFDFDRLLACDGGIQHPDDTIVGRRIDAGDASELQVQVAVLGIEPFAFHFQLPDVLIDAGPFLVDQFQFAFGPRQTADAAADV